MSFEHLLSPLDLGPRRMRNRVQVTGHTTCFADADHLPADRDVHYFAARAAGGAALLCTGTNNVHPSSPIPYGTYANFDERIVPRLRTLADAVHEHGALMLVQLGHMAQRNYDEPVPTWAPSPVAIHTGGTLPHAMTPGEIADVVEAFGAAAARARAAGLDGVEVGFGHGQLVNLFLSPLSNRRTDGYGGSPEGRMRFALEVLRAVREAIGDDGLVGVRVNADDGVEGGLDADDWIAVGRAVEATGDAHFLNVSRDFQESLVPTMHERRGLWLDPAARLRAAVGMPVFAAGRVVDPEEAEAAIAAGAVDAVGMTRAHIADPDLVRKLREGRRDRIRPCVGCAQMCIGQVQRGRPISCIYNAVTGAEREWGAAERSRAPRPRRVAVVGGGPGGLEAARMAALRGHDVVLLERAAALGGAAALAAAVPGRGEMRRLVDWYAAELERLGVEVRLETEAGASTLRALEADAVILAPGATGVAPAGAGARGLDARAVVGGAPVDGHVVVVDRDHFGHSLFAAAAAQERGCTVTVVTDRLFVASAVERPTREALYRRVLGAGARFVPSHRLAVAAAGDDGVAVRLTEVHTGREAELEADWLVSTASAPDESLAGAVLDGVEVRWVGDAVAPRRIDSAVRDAFAAAVAL